MVTLAMSTIQKLTESEAQIIFQKKLPAVLECFQQNGIDARLFGTFGRAVSLGIAPPSFLDRSGHLDVDFYLIPSPNETEASVRLTVTEAQEIGCPANIDIRWKKISVTSNGLYCLNYRNIKIPVDPDTLSPKRGTILGTSVSTFDLNTLAHLTAINMLRPKDYATLLFLSRQIVSSPKSFLPESKFTDYHRLMKERRARYPIDTTYEKLRWIYHYYVSYENRVKISPYIRIFKQLLSVGQKQKTEITH